jgi:molybdopterin-guanine dinucleotide biosynthesis protein A
VIHDDVCAAIVAGGQATRLAGRDKSRLVIRGQSIIVRQLEILQRVARDVVIVSSHADGRHDGCGAAVIPDVIPGIGPMGGVLTALEQATAPLVVVLACDLPFVDERVLDLLIVRARAADGAWVRTARGSEPLIACYRMALAPTLRAAIDRGVRRMSDLEQLFDLRAVDERDLLDLGVSPDVLVNVNTPDDLARIQ